MIHVALHLARHKQATFWANVSPFNRCGEQSGGLLWLWASHGMPGEQTVLGLLLSSVTIVNSTAIERHIRYKIALLVRHYIVSVAPEYLIQLCHPANSSFGRQILWSVSHGDLIVPRYWLVKSQFLGLKLVGIRQSDNLMLLRIN